MKAAELIKSPAFQFGIIAIILVAVLWFVFNKLEDFMRLFSGKDTVVREDEAASANPANLTYPLIQYTLIANSIEVGLEPYNDDEEAVYNAFKKIKNNDDLLQTMTAFGTRKATPLGIGMIGGYEGTLSEWITFNLTPSEVQHINQILQSNGVTISF